VTPDALLPLVLSRSDHVLWLWCFHAAVSFGLFALALTVPAFRTDRRLARLLVFGYAFYAYTHLECMRWEVMQWGVVADLLKAQPGFDQSVVPPRFPLGKVADAPHPVWIIPFHLVFDAGVVYALWAAVRPRPAG
jgi:hypothetical protein